MSTIGASPGGAGRLPVADRTPWSSQAQDVRGVRRAITAHRQDRPVDTDVAPMMGELLHRLDTLEGPRAAASVMAAPAAPDPVNPPAPERVLRAMGTACAKVRAQLHGAQQAQGADPAQQQQLQGMLRVLEDHLQMKHEVVARAARPQG